MKKLVIAAICEMCLVSDLYTMNVKLVDVHSKESDTPTVKKLPIIERSDSRIRLFELENKELLPKPMSTEEYIDMLKKFLTENDQFFDPTEFIERVDKNIREINFGDFKDFYVTREESGTDALLPEDIQIIDFSCPNVIKYAERKIAEPSIVPVNPVILSDGESLQLSHLKWIIGYFRPHIDKILMHQMNPADKYGSGISDDDIDLIIKLTVGKNRLFGIDDMSEGEKIEFRDTILRIVLQNATGFQRVLSLLIMSIINCESKTQFWHIDVQFLKTKYGSYQKYDKNISE